MTESPVINPEALERLYDPWEEPNSHRVRVDKPAGAPPRIVTGRRTSPIAIAQNLRGWVKEWRESGYATASDTTRTLLNHWFERSHRQTTPAGEEFEFRYYFCQREAIESFIYLMEMRRLRCVSQVIHDFFGQDGPDKDAAVKGIEPSEDDWARYAFKLATGAGKTKVMSLAIVYSYFHALRESDSDMARHFVIIAPNLTVFERLREDFRPVGGGPDIFENDPLIPPEWKGDWNMSVVLQDEAGGTVSGGALYLTNIHRLYDAKIRKGKEATTYDFMGPPVSKAKALDTGEELRDRITAHPRVMVLNDEAHHVWDQDSAWNEAIRFLHETVRKRTGGGLVAQLDFTATPKDNHGRIFKHVVCDAPLGEAVDGGIVKIPIIGRADDLKPGPDDNAAYKYEKHLLVGYERWKVSREEWQSSDKKPLLFVMCSDTKEADEIAQRLNTDPVFREVNQKTINLHTNLKGKIKWKGKGNNRVGEFIPSDKEISDDDLKALRTLSRELDQNSSQYRCIVSVLMLREGWDVRNVTTIIPLRPLNSKADILPEQTLGRGLRRMTPPGQTNGHVNETVVVVDHPAFVDLYQKELSQEGVFIETVDVDKAPRTTVSIFPDSTKDLEALDILLPQLTAGHQMLPKLEDLSMEDVKRAFEQYYKPLPLGGKGSELIEYEGRQLFTGEIVEQMKFHLPLLKSGAGAVSYYVKELETTCKVRNTFSTLGPLVRAFLEGVLFDTKTDLYDERLVSRLADSDVREHIRAVFVPLIRKRITTTEVRAPESQPISLAGWKSFQATHSEKHPAIPSSKTLFNLVPCNRALEVAFAEFATTMDDVVAFAKNAGPQCLRIDYLAMGHRLAFYTPDFFVRGSDGHYYLVETKGRVDQDVSVKARAAIEWCKVASTKKVRWEYLYVPQDVFGQFTGHTIEELARTCAPSLKALVGESPQEIFLPGLGEDEKPELDEFITGEQLASLPKRYQTAIDHAVQLFKFQENKDWNFSSVINLLFGVMDDAATTLMVTRLEPHLPSGNPEQDDWFSPYLGGSGAPPPEKYTRLGKDLKRSVVFKNGLSPIGLLTRCFDYAINDKKEFDGVFTTLKAEFTFQGCEDLHHSINLVNVIRNTYVAHQAKPLTDKDTARDALKLWINTIIIMRTHFPPAHKAA